jgi:iron complex transport system ATP-binding protein
MMALVRLDDVGFAYDERPVLRRISFEVEPGEFVGIVGPNGSGKSTLIDLIDGILRPVSGDVLVKGTPTRRYRRRDMAREVALVPQQFDLDFDLSVREVVEMGAYCRVKAGEACADAGLVLARLEVGHLVDRRFTELSGGEKQLVVLAQALMQQAELLLLDEPASALDVSHQLRLFDLLRSLNTDGLTVLCILHDLNLALHYFDKLLVLSGGEVAAFGPPQEVLEPALLEAVYGVRAYQHRHAGRTFLTFSPRLRGERRGRVHLICGGGTGAGLMRELVDAGYEVSAGVLNALDTDEETGRDLGLQMAVEAPFSPVGDEAHAENLRLAAAADLVIMAAVPIGHGNARNVEAARAALAAGTPLWVADGVRDADLTGATAQLDGAESYADDAAMLAALEARGDLRAP